MAAKINSHTGTRARSESGLNHIFDCLLNAAVNAFVIMLLGRIALGIVSGVAGRMIPSAPPGFASGPGSGYVTEAGAWWDALFSLRFKIFYAAMFLVCLREQLTRATPADAGGRIPRWRRIGWNISENWFGSLIGNAFLAMALAVVLARIPDFSVWQWAWHWLLQVVPVGAWLDDGPLTWLNPWLTWYDHNKVKFNFWLIYFAAVCDDFGIPNFKTLARWFWRRWRKPQSSATTKSCEVNSSEKA